MIRTDPQVPTYLLPTAAYLSQDWFDREQRELFTKRWAHVAALDDFSRPGDYVAVQVGSAPIVVVLGEDGELRAFHNLCRHRGMVMLEGSGNCGDGVDCFYHRWRYSLEGDLVRVPQRKEQFADLDTSEWGLLPAGIGVWEGLVFVNADPHGLPFESMIAGAAENIGSYRPGLLAQVSTRSFDAHCNWKLFVENHVDVYHLWYLHEETLGDFDHTKFEYVHVDGDWFSYEPLRADRSGLSRGETEIEHIAPRDRSGIGAHLLFPNTMIATTSEFVTTYVAVPIAPDRTRVDVRLRAQAGVDGEALMDATASFITEDIVACERVQQAVASPAYAIGPLAREHEQPITMFHEYVLAGLDSEISI